MTLKEFSSLYAMSKMVVANESEEGLLYLRTKFLELLELICRVAVYKFDNTDQEEMSLVKKIEHVLDELFANMRPPLKRSEDEDASDSDEPSDVSEDEY